MPFCALSEAKGMVIKMDKIYHLKKIKDYRIIDSHVHLGKHFGKNPVYFLDIEKLIKNMDRVGIEKSIVFPLFLQNPETDNEYINNCAKKYPDRIVPFLCIKLWEDNQLNVIRKYVEEYKFLGIKLHPTLQGFAMDDIKLLVKLFEYCKNKGLLVTAHGAGDSPFNMPYQFEEIANAFPEVNIIMAHSGFMWACNQAIKVAKRNKNIYLDMTATGSNTVREAIEEIGAEKIVMGSDYPFTDVEVEIIKIDLAVSDRSKKRLILGENILNLLKIS